MSYSKTKKNKKKLKLRYKFLIFIVVLIFLFSLYLNYIVNPLIFSVNKAKLQSEATNCLSLAISSTLSNTMYENLININKNDAGDIVLISCNSANINKLSNNIITNCQQNLSTLTNSGFDVPLLSFTGLSFLNGLGPNVNIKMQPVGFCSCKYSSSFQSSGINQTLHQIYINVSATVNVLMPINTFSFDVKSQVLVAESVVIGKIPEVYLNGSLFGNSLNLVP